MLDDIQNSPFNPQIQRPNADALQAVRQNQQLSTNLGNKTAAQNFAFPSNDEIEQLTAQALDQQAQGRNVPRGSVLDILV